MLRRHKDLRMQRRSFANLSKLLALVAVLLFGVQGCFAKEMCQKMKICKKSGSSDPEVGMCKECDEDDDCKNKGATCERFDFEDIDSNFDLCTDDPDRLCDPPS
jgi:hypothetical protein